MNLKLTNVGLVLFVIAAVTMVLLYNNHVDDSQPSMPPPSADRKQVYEAYKLGFLSDGYPGKKTDHGLVAHPIYGPHVIRDYLRLYENGGGDLYLQASEKVAKAGIARMDKVGDAYVFMYKAGDGISTKNDDHYSALTQAQWLYVLGLLWETTGNQFYLDSAEKILLSLNIPVEDGGVAIRLSDGISLEEWPSQVPSYILNGWTTAILNVYWYSQITGSQAALELFYKNIPPLERMLPLYDFENLANTRYQLSGFVYLKAKTEDKKLKVISGNVQIPTEGIFSIDSKGKDRWRNHLKPVSGKQQLINVVLSRASFPTTNKVELVFNNKNPTSVTIEIANGDYSPLSTAMPAKDWLTLGTYYLREPNSKLLIDIPWEKADLVAYPTNFKKKYGDDFYNAYHFIHIMNIRKLAEITNSKIFDNYARKWENYVEKWPSMAVYVDTGVKLKKFSAQQLDE